MEHKVTHPDGTVSIDELESLLGDLDLDDGRSTGLVDDEIIGEMPLEADAGPLSEEDERTLEEVVIRADAYDGHEDGSTVSLVDEKDVIEASPDVVKVKKAARTKVAKKEPAPRAKDVSSLEPEHFVLRDGEEASEAYKATVVARRPKQKKIAEKFDNLLVSVAAGKQPSIYTMQCFRTLFARKEVTGSDFVATLQSGVSGKAYTLGTARSQAGQMMELFKTLAIGDRDGQKLTLRGDSALVKKLLALL